MRPWLLVSAAWIGPAILAVVNEFAQRRLTGEKPPDLGTILFASGDWLVYAFLTPAVFAIAGRWPVARPHAVGHSFLHLAMSLGFCVAWATMGALLRTLVMPEGLFGGGFFMHLVFWTFITLPFGVPVYLSVVGVEHAIRYFVEARDRQVQLARLSEQLSTARFAALQAQLNPHFLFNTLNTVTVLVRDDDKAGATRIVEQLADVLRRTLTKHRANEVPLEEELELVRQYVAIEQARFSDRLRVIFEIEDSTLAATVPSFAIQHLVENAIRHGIAKQPSGGEVRLAARRDSSTRNVTVSENGPAFDDALLFSRGGGIENIRERLRALYGDRASLAFEHNAAGGTVAILRLPFREVPMEVGRGDG